MNNTRYNWKRFWYPRDSSLNLADDGYLPDPDSQSSRFWNKNVISLDEISDLKTLVLLGDPGMGKSTILSEQESVWAKKPHDSSEKYLFINLRSYQTDSRLAAHLFESPIFKAWLAGTHTLHLFLDSLDEGLLSIKVLAACLADEFKKLPSERLYLRIACRTVEWPDLLENGLADWLGKEVVQHYVLAPLRKKDVEEAARVSGLDAKLFLGQVESSAVVPFAIKPVTLNFLLSVYRKQGSLPSSQSALYLKGCRLLAAETSESRDAAGYKGELTAEQRLAVAARIAASMIFGNRNAVYLGANPAEAPSEDVEIRELSSGTESGDDVRFNVGEKEIEEILGTGLFSTRGSNRIGWGHQTYAEFLAAWYLEKHDVSISQIKSLITHPGETERCQEQFPRSNEGRPRNTLAGKLFLTPFRAPSTTCVRTLPRSSSSTTIASGCIRRWAITHRKSSSTRLARRPLQLEPPCGYSGLERWLERHQQPGIRLKQQRRGEEHHSINHQLCSFLCLTGGVHPM